MEDFYEQTTPMPTKNNGVLGGFVDWYDSLDEAKKSAITTGLMSAGLKMMESGGRAYDRPVSSMSVIGAGGLTGLGEYHNTLGQERAHGLRTGFLNVQQDYLGMNKERFNAEKPYMGEAARMDNEMRGLQIQKAKEPPLVEGSPYGYYRIKGDNATEVMPPMVNPKGMGEEQKVKFNQSKEVIDIITRQMGANFGGSMINMSPDQLMKAIKDNPTQFQRITDELNRPGNELKKKSWDSAWGNIYESMGVKPDAITPQNASNKNVDDYIDSRLNYSF